MHHSKVIHQVKAWQNIVGADTFTAAKAKHFTTQIWHWVLHAF